MALKDGDLQAPIIIIVDELDRCRPTYAIKLLEEIKHLFDVPGLVFVFGLFEQQLARSISGAYGPNFDGSTYLRRFINRTYSLVSPNLGPLISMLFVRTGIEDKLLIFPAIETNKRPTSETPALTLARYMDAFGLGARDAFQVVDTLQTCLALNGQSPIIMPYLVPLLISRRFKSAPDGTIMDFDNRKAKPWIFVLDYSDPHHSPTKSDPQDLGKALKSIATSEETIHVLVNKNPAALWAFRSGPNIFNENTLANPRRYPELLETVGRFSTPKVLIDPIL